MAKAKVKMIEMNAELAVAAILGLQIKRSELDAKIAELRLIASSEESSSSSPVVSGTAKRRRSFSAASRKKMAEAQRKRWAAIKKNVTGTSAKHSGNAGTPTKKNKGTGKPAKKTATKNL